MTSLETVAMPPPARQRRSVVLAAIIWLATVAMGLAMLGVTLFTDFVIRMTELNGATPTSDDLLVFRAVVIAFFAVVVGYASVGALLAGRAGAGRIAALLLAGGGLFVLVPFGYAIGGSLTMRDPDSALFSALLLLGPVALGPAYATILPGLAIAFPDGSLPSRRWRLPVGIVVGIIAGGTFLNLVRPGPVAGGTAGRNPFGIDAIPELLVNIGSIGVIGGVLAITALGVAAVIVRYRSGNPVERQQQRWFLGAVSLAALPLALSILPGIGGPASALVAAIGLMLVPIAVGIAVARYRLYEIDHLINRTLVYVPLTALLAGLYAATVALLQRVFQTVTGDKSDAAIVISTLILASVFTPLRKWLEGMVERRFKPVAGASPLASTALLAPAGPDWEARVAVVALRVVRAELAARATVEPPIE
jgi:hypothetical protein